MSDLEKKIWAILDHPQQAALATVNDAGEPPRGALRDHIWGE